MMGEKSFLNQGLSMMMKASSDVNGKEGRKIKKFPLSAYHISPMCISLIKVTERSLFIGFLHKCALI